MNTRAMSAVSGSLIMWVLAAAWWLQTDRSVVVTIGALVIGGLGTVIAVAGSQKPVPTRRRALLAVGIGVLVAAALAFLARFPAFDTVGAHT
jgi:hypothetical protein